MNKKTLLIAIGVVAVCIIAAVVFLVLNTKKGEDNVSQNEPISNQQQGDIESNSSVDNNESTDKKILVVYYSAQNHTEAVANKIASNLNADLFEIIPTNVYTSDDLDWTNSNSRVSRENNDESLRDVEIVSSQVDNWDSYDTVLIGYPIWWGIAAWPTNTFVKANDFTGKTVIPFCTSSSSGLGRSGDLLASDANGGQWLQGIRFSSNPSDDTIRNWTDTIN